MPTRRRKPITPTLVVIVGLLVGITGLLMLLLGIGVISPTNLSIGGVNLNLKLQTATPGIVVMVIGFAVALAPILMAMYVDSISAGVRRESAKQPRTAEDELTYLRNNLNRESMSVEDLRSQLELYGINTEATDEGLPDYISTALLKLQPGPPLSMDAIRRLLAESSEHPPTPEPPTYLGAVMQEPEMVESAAEPDEDEAVMDEP